jgi:hypothetical protein
LPQAGNEAYDVGWGKGNVCKTTGILGSVFFLALGAASLLARPAAGQAILAPSPLEQSMQETPTPAASQKYDGVVPSPTTRNPLPAAPKVGAYLVWTGFQMTATGSRVFLQTTQTVPFAVDEGRANKAGRSTLLVRLEGCRIHMANNRRRIDTRYFASPVSSISARQRGRNVEVRIALREVASVTPHSEAGPDGTEFLVLDFPPGKATPEPSPLEDMAKASGLGDGAEQPLAVPPEPSSPERQPAKARR